MAHKANAHEQEEEARNRAPNIGKQLIGENKRDDDDEIEDAKHDFLQPGVFEIGCVPASEEIVHVKRPRKWRQELGILRGIDADWERFFAPLRIW